MKVFLGGTCNDSPWREELISMLEIDYFNPVVDDWNEEAKEREKKEREECDYTLYVITPEMYGFYSIAEAVDDSNKKEEQCIFCYLENYNGKEFDEAQRRSLEAVGQLVKENGGNFYKSLTEIAERLNP